MRSETSNERIPQLTPRALSALCGVALLGALLTAAPALAAPPSGGHWEAIGPAPIEFAQVENIVPNNEADGAIHTVVAHPTNPDVLWVGSVNGGIWRTDNATALRPDWRRLTDDQASQSIGALELDPSDPRHRTLVAGIGLYSSFGRIGGLRNGLLRSTNAGNSWSTIDGGGVLFGKNVSGVAPRGDTIVISVNEADAFTFGNIGIWRSTDGGATFTQIATGTGAATGLPGGVTYDLVGDPNDPSRLYTSVVFADLIGGANGVYRSDDTGATWTKVSDPAIDALLISGVTSNVEFDVGAQGQVYAAIANSGRLAGLFRSDDAGATWTAMDLPGTIEDGVFIGIHPGGQASIHMSIVADPTDENIVYLGGDRQPFLGEGSGGPGFFPNSIGANNFSGRLFRCDASEPTGSQCAHLTHRNDLGPAGGGTASNSSPHADSREMRFDANGDVVQVDDGGVYRRTDPRSDTGDWFSINGDIGVNEQHDAAFDALSSIAFSGNQDNGTTVQDTTGFPNWFLLLSGDGGDVATDETSIPGITVRFSSAQFLQAFNRTFWDASNNFLAFDFPPLQVVGGGSPVVPQFTTPVEVNAVDGQRLIIGGANSTYESFDQGFTLTEIGPGVGVNGNGRDAVSYGAPGNPDVLYVGSETDVYVRTGPPPAPLALSTTFPGSPLVFTIRDIVIDQDDWQTAFVITTVNAYVTHDAGATWTTITGSLPSQTVTPLRSITHVPGVDDDDPATSDDAILVGTTSGVMIATEHGGFTDWKPFGAGLPTVPVFDLEYDPAADLVHAGTLGRGSWVLSLGE